MASKYRIEKISAATIAEIKRKSAANLPDRPSERGMKPAEIKHTFYGPIVDPEKSIIAELQRVIGEINLVLDTIEEDTEITVTPISGGRRVTITFGGKTASFDILNGGAGVSPTFEVTKIEGGHRLTITDADGTKQLDIMDGSDGNNGENGSIAGYTIDLELDNTTYVMTATLKDDAGAVVSQDTIDLPLESVVTDVKEENGIITITLQNGNTASYDITDLVNGLVSQKDYDAKMKQIDDALGLYVTDMANLIGGEALD